MRPLVSPKVVDVIKKRATRLAGIVYVAVFDYIRIALSPAEPMQTHVLGDSATCKQLVYPQKKCWASST